MELYKANKIQRKTSEKSNIQVLNKLKRCEFH